MPVVTRRLRSLATLATVVVAAVVMSGCAAPRYQYVANDDQDAVLRVPRTWTQINTTAVLTASGQDTTSTNYGWLVFFDSSDRPSTAHVESITVAAPVLIARSADIAEQYRTTLTDDELRDLLEPVTASARATDDASRIAAGLQPRVFVSIQDVTIDTATERGVHEVYSYSFDGVTEYYDQIAVTDPKRTRVHVVLVHCSAACYHQDHAEMDAAVDSLTVKKP